MAAKLAEKTFIDSINYRAESGHIEVRRSTVVMRGGEEISRQYHRHIVEPDAIDLTGEDELVQLIGGAVADDRKAKAKLKTRTAEGDPPKNRSAPVPQDKLN